MEAFERQSRTMHFDPEYVRSGFGIALPFHEELGLSHDLLAYELIPALEACYFSGRHDFSQATEVVLLVVSLGLWAKTGFITIWSILRYRTCRLRIFVLGDLKGLQAWRNAVEELSEAAAEKFRGVVFEYVDFKTHSGFQAFLR